MTTMTAQATGIAGNELAAPEPPGQGLPTRAESRLIQVADDSEFALYLDTAKFNHIYRIATVFSESSLVPQHYRGKENVANCFISCQMAFRLRVDPLMFLQKSYVVHGKPGIEATLAIALINSSGLFADPLDYEIEGTNPKDDSYRVRAIATRKGTGKVVHGPWVDWAMIKGEGWLGKEGSKWKTMPGVMFQYRAASFFGRTVCPERLMGMHMVDELEDMTPAPAPSIDAIPDGRSSFVTKPDGTVVKEVENTAAKTPAPAAAEPSQAYVIPKDPDPSVKPGARFLYLQKVARLAGCTLGDGDLNKVMTDFLTRNKVELAELKDPDKFLAVWEAFRSTDWSAQQAP